ncbi:MAG: hypothetical protein KKB91_02565 [Proteobacteria bacterium]|nr:hypothetical protein [Desulfocapsa sp.]MBU3945814.1 hypothetical protein [Pseudomonadota bacterium]MCG2745460.1 hypothetical protein [Desulfobacteraceae bacterium]MBU3983474.1 hypothetical protein [Pseudomonadota bacterium]MBU4030106.1 hypothetical protein [Pseudomonadota bacterium]
MTKKDFMTPFMIAALAIPLTLCIPSNSHAGDIGVNIHLGVPLPPVIVPRPVYRRPVPIFYFNESPEFIYSPFLSFSVAIGSPYDLFYDNNAYYIFHQGYWHRSSRLDGPWRIVDYRSLPRAFHRHKIEQIRRYRDKEYDVYRHHRQDSPDKRYSPRYNRDHRERDHRNYREERRPREYERRHH